ncbi:MAG: hypothetical protein WAM91_09530 [Candidatus Acidiferrales bacterium]
MKKTTYSGRQTRDIPTSGLDRLGGKKLSQHGTEFFHKIKEVRKHPTGGHLHGRPHRAG